MTYLPKYQFMYATRTESCLSVLQEHCERLLRRLDDINVRHLSRHDVVNVIILRHDLNTYVRGYDAILYVTVQCCLRSV